MAKKDKTDRKSFEDMRAEREAAVNADLAAASDGMAEAQGEAMLANIRKRTDEVKGIKERKRNYHLQQGKAVIDNEKERVKNTSVNVGAPQSPLSFEQEDISGNADKTFKRSMAKNQYGVRQDFGKRALAAETDATIAASDKMADRQEEDALANIKSLIAKRERDIADRRAAEERKQKYLSDQQAAINANKKPAEVPATPAGGGQKKTEVPGKEDVPGEMENVRNGRAARAANYDANSTQEKLATPARGENAEAEAENRAAAGRAARAAKYEENGQTEQTATPAGGGKEQTDVPGKTDVPGVDAGKRPAAGPAPIIHNAEERFKKNVENVKENLKYEHVFDLIRKYEEERQKLADNRSESQKKKDARREKMAKIFAAIGDGVAAMSSLIFASKGAIPYQSKSMLTKAVGDRYAQFSKDLEDRKAKSLALSERINELKEGVRKAKEEDERLKAAQKRLEEEDGRKRSKEARDAKSQEIQDQYTLRAIKKMDDDARRNNEVLQVRQALLEVQRMNAQTARMRANNQRSGGGRGRTIYITPWDGKQYGNYREWEAAVNQKADELNIDRYEIVDYRSGRNRNQKVVPKPTTRIAGEVANKVGGKASSLKL